MSSKEKLRISEELSDLENVIVDTSVLIEYSKAKKLELLDGSYISVITLIEFLRYYRDDRTRKELKSLLESFFKVVSLDNDVVLTYCSLYNSLRERGMQISDADLLIASCALSKDLTLYTLDLKHFERLEEFGLKLLRIEGGV